MLFIYEIHDLYHKIIIRLKTRLSDTSTVYLDVYKEGSNTPRVYSRIGHTLDDGSKLLTFTVPNKDWEIGDVLEKFIVRIGGTRNLYQLHEGITILVDGEEGRVQKVTNGAVVKKDGKPVEIDTVTNSQFALTFNDGETHTVQAIYKGNSEIGVATSEKITITPIGYDTGESTTNAPYVLTQTIPSKMAYLDSVDDWTWTLTKGGAGVADKTIETILFEHIWSETTNDKGKAGVTGATDGDRRTWEVGSYKIGGQFYHYDEQDPNTKSVLAECWSTIEVVKATPTLYFFPAGTVGNTAQFRLIDPLGQGMPNRTVTMYVNSKAYVRTTDELGKVYVRMNETGNFNYKAVFAGEKNYNSVTETANETINS